ncbi:MAG: carbohydrate kinase family protein [Caldilineae bacterium]|nr:MAG: carbohydrate kinase family protein [Caldilineae bacterium]
MSAVSGKDFQRLFAPGRLVEIGAVSFATGGPVANTGLALNRLGVRALLMGKVGADLFGEQVLRLVAQVDPALAEGMVVDELSRTSYTIVINPPQVDRIFLHYAGANDTFVAADVKYEQVAQARVFHFGYPPIMKSMYMNGGAELVELFRRAHATGATTTLDMSLPDPTTAGGRADWQGILRRLLPYVGIFLPSAEEILFMLWRREYERLAAQGDVLAQITPGHLSALGNEMLEMGAGMVVIKLGARGLYLRTGSRERLGGLGRGAPARPDLWADRELWAPAFRVEEVGATGSGDAAIAGFITALLQGMSPEETVTMATAVGACNVEAADGLSGIRTWEATRERVAGGWPKHDLQLDAAGWHFDAENQLWQCRAQD